jgi:hypothetical protein
MDIKLHNRVQNMMWETVLCLVNLLCINKEY